LRLEPVLDAPPTSKTVKSRQAWIYAQSGLLNEILGICGAPVTQKLPSARVDIVDTSWRLISSNLCVCNAVRRIRLTGPGCHDFLNLRGGCQPSLRSVASFPVGGRGQTLEVGLTTGNSACHGRVGASVLNRGVSCSRFRQSRPPRDRCGPSGLPQLTFHIDNPKLRKCLPSRTASTAARRSIAALVFKT
jgi:hypothetical protein